MSATHRIIIGDCIEGMRTLPDGCVHCCITSPPYWGLRDYGVEGQLGLEATPDEFVAKMVAVFREVRRVLRDDGTLWLNLGDSYAGGGNYRGVNSEATLSAKQRSNGGARGVSQLLGAAGKDWQGCKPKDLCGIPWRVAFALQADGWYLRQDIIWAKPNPMPESVTDRCTKAHEYVFLLTKSARYYYDAEAVKEAATPCRVDYTGDQKNNTVDPVLQATRMKGRVVETGSSKNRRSVWTIPTAPFSEAHFATFPPKLVEPCILAGTSAKGCCAKCGAPWERVVERTTQSESIAGPKSTAKREQGLATAFSGYADGSTSPSFRTLGWQPTCACGGEPVPCTVLDCFGGSGTVAAVALPLGRNAILCELNPAYAAMAERRIGMAVRPDTYRDESKADDAPLFMEARG